MKMFEIRKVSWNSVSASGLETNPLLPVHEPPTAIRKAKDVCDRTLILHCRVACAYGFPRQKAIEWLETMELRAQLLPEEEAFFAARNGVSPGVQWEVEAVWALTWATGHHSTLKILEPCSDELSNLLPNLGKEENAEEFRARTAMKSIDSIMEALDESYCFHWAVVAAQLNRRKLPRNVDALAVRFRRHALEWIIGNDDQWNEIYLDT